MMNSNRFWDFDDETYERTLTSFDNPDFVDVVIHSYRHRCGLAAGSLVFGGGHVVLPLLQAEVVPKGWEDNNTFLAGY